MIQNPLVSVLLPAYNCETTILDSVKSILNQTYSNFELIVIDDHSTDKTLEVLKSIHDKRIRIFSNKRNMQLAATLNKGFKLCKGEYVARMDADDISFSHRLEKQVLFLRNNPDYLLIGSAYIKEVDLVNKGIRKQVIGYEKLKSKLLFGNNICHPSVMINRNLWMLNNLSYDESFKYAQDFDLWTRAILSCKMDNLPDALIIYRKYSNNLIADKSDVMNANCELSTIKYIQKLFINVSEEEAKELFLFYRKPELLSLKSAIRMYFKSLSKVFQPDHFDYVDFVFRINNQLLKIILR